MTGLLRRFGMLGAVACVCAAPAAASAPATSVTALTTSPALFPDFSPSVADYVTRCGAAPVRVSAGGAHVVIDGLARTHASIRLRAGQGFTVSAGARSYHVRCLPPDFPAWTVTRKGTPSEAWYVVSPSLSLGPAKAHYVALFDGDGVPVWWYRTKGQPIDAKVLPGPAVAWATYPVDSHAAYEIRFLDGTLAHRVGGVGGLIDDHELLRAANGDYVFLMYRPKPHVDLSALGGGTDETVLEAEIDEVTPRGKRVWSWTSDGTISLDEASRWAKTIVGQPAPLPGGGVGYDVFHANAIELTKDAVLLSLRQTDAVYAISRRTGTILWKLGGTPTPASLALQGDPVGSYPFGGQHDVRALPDGTVTVYDDATFTAHAPRAVRYRVDAAARTATFVEAVSDPDVTSSFCCGSARKLRSGDWLVSWGNDDVVGEYAPDGTPVLRVTFDSVFSYRIVPVDAGTVGAAALRAGMDAMHPRR